MLQVGGRLVYSTCSLNPVEDEAVLYRLLQETGDSVEIVDSSHLVPGLKYASGINKWKVAGKEKDILYDSFSQVPEKYHTQIRPHMFAPEEGIKNSEFHLDRCMRVLPHQQDTGGFFVAVLHKKALCPWESKKAHEEFTERLDKANGESTKSVQNVESKFEPLRKKPRYQGYKEDPFIYFEEHDPAFEEIKEYFKLSKVCNSPIRCLLAVVIILRKVLL